MGDEGGRHGGMVQAEHARRRAPGGAQAAHGRRNLRLSPPSGVYPAPAGADERRRLGFMSACVAARTPLYPTLDDPPLRLASRHSRRRTTRTGARAARPHRRRQGRAAAPCAGLPARARAPADRGHPGRRQVDARARAGGDARPQVLAHPVHERPAARRRARRVDLRRALAARSASTRGRSSTPWCSPTRSTARRPRRRARCSRRWRSARSRIDGQTRKLPDPFFVIATQNPVEQIGAYPLPESQLDRFLMAIELGYPDAAAERELLVRRRSPRAHRRARRRWPTRPRSPTGSARPRDIHVAPALLDYVQALLAASRGHSGERAAATPARARGLSPRAGLMLLAAARALRDDRVAPDGAAGGRAGGVSLGRRSSARRRHTRGRGAGADAPARRARCRKRLRRAAHGRIAADRRRSASAWLARVRQRAFRHAPADRRAASCCATRASTSCRRAAAGR